MFKKTAFIALSCYLASFYGYAEGLVSKIPSLYASEEPADFSYFLPMQDYYVNWTFSGIVNNEQGEQYGYFFQIERRGNKLHSNAALFDAESKQIIFQDHNESVAISSLYHWQVGHSFLTFNPITASWVFGLKTNQKQGFNFKINMLAQSNDIPTAEAIRPGMSVIISQANSLNGHIRKDRHSEEFVTAKHAWFRQISMNSMDDSQHLVSGLLCHFDDNSRFYAMRLPESDALRGSMAGHFNAKGEPALMSQFVQIKQQEGGGWEINIPSSDEHFLLSDYLQQNTFIAGFVKYHQLLGFCLLSDETIGRS